MAYFNQWIYPGKSIATITENYAAYSHFTVLGLDFIYCGDRRQMYNSLFNHFKNLHGKVRK